MDEVREFEAAKTLRKANFLHEAAAGFQKLMEQREIRFGQDATCLDYMDHRNECLVQLCEFGQAENSYRSSLDRWKILGGQRSINQIAHLRLKIAKCIAWQFESLDPDDAEKVLTADTKRRYHECVELLEQAIEE